MIHYKSSKHVLPGLATRRELAERGLKPARGQKAIATVSVWYGNGWTDAHLYQIADAVPKTPPTPAQAAAMERARAALAQKKICPRCGADKHPSASLCRTCDARITAVQKAQTWLSTESVILDTETTDLFGEVVEIAVIDMTGQVLFESLIRPATPISEGARAVHGISMDDVSAAPTINDVWPSLFPILADAAHVITYNADFDHESLIRSLKNMGNSEAAKKTWFMQWRCAMRAYACWYGERYDQSDQWNDFKWQKLPGAGHRALTDCNATLKLLKMMAESENGYSPNGQFGR